MGAERDDDRGRGREDLGFEAEARADLGERLFEAVRGSAEPVERPREREDETDVGIHRPSVVRKARRPGRQPWHFAHELTN